MNNLDIVIDRAIEVLGNEEKAKDWVEKMSSTLGDKPINLLETDEGLSRVLFHLGGIERSGYTDL